MSRESKKVRKERRERNKIRKAELLQPSGLPIDKAHSRARLGSLRGRTITLAAMAVLTDLSARTPEELESEIRGELIRRHDGEPES